METFVLKVTGREDVKFVGELLASHHEEKDSEHGESVALYKTAGGNFVLQNCSHSKIEGERDVCLVVVCETEEEVKESLGQGIIPDIIYEQAGIENTVFID